MNTTEMYLEALKSIEDCYDCSRDYATHIREFSFLSQLKGKYKGKSVDDYLLSIKFTYRFSQKGCSDIRHLREHILSVQRKATEIVEYAMHLRKDKQQGVNISLIGTEQYLENINLETLTEAILDHLMIKTVSITKTKQPHKIDFHIRFKEPIL